MTTLVAGLQTSGITVPCVFDGAINGERFRAYVERAGLRARKAAERTRKGLWQLIGQTLDRFQPQECRNFFKNAGYAI